MRRSSTCCGARKCPRTDRSCRQTARSSGWSRVGWSTAAQTRACRPYAQLRCDRMGSCDLIRVCATKRCHWSVRRPGRRVPMLARALSGKAVPASSTLGSGKPQGRSPHTPVHGRDGRQPCAGDRPRPGGGPPRGCGPACPAHGGRTLWAATARWSQLLRGGVDAAELPGPGEGVLGPSPVDQEPTGLPAQSALSGWRPRFGGRCRSLDYAG
jgi:hypothetical protein